LTRSAELHCLVISGQRLAFGTLTVFFFFHFDFTLAAVSFVSGYRFRFGPCLNFPGTVAIDSLITRTLAIY